MYENNTCFIKNTVYLTRSPESPWIPGVPSFPGGPYKKKVCIQPWRKHEGPQTKGLPVYALNILNI